MAPAASAATTVSIKVAPFAAPGDFAFGDTAQTTGTVAIDGVAASGQPVTLEGRPYPYAAEFAPLLSDVTGPTGTYTFMTRLKRNWQLRVVAPGATSERIRVFGYPGTTLSVRARGWRMFKLTQRYLVPADVRLEQPTIFYASRRGRKTAPRVGIGKVTRVRAGRYASAVIVRLPANWPGRLMFASCFRHTRGSGMGNPRATMRASQRPRSGGARTRSCPRRFRF